MSIEVADSLNVGKTDVVLDVRSRIEKEEDIYNIKYPVRGGLVYCIENEKFYVIKTLVAAEINGYTIANYKVGIYEELGNGGGAEYTAGEGIAITENVISVDWDKVAKKEDIKVYSAGENITISEDGVISAKDTKYSAGNGIAISAEGVISCTVEPGSGIEGDFVTQDEFDTALGDINSILDAINGEEV